MSKFKSLGLLTEQLNAADYVTQAKLAEAMGFDSFWVPEDYVMPAAFSALGACAAVTSRIKLGTGVVNPYTRHPVLLGMELAALDQISGGRAILGVGASIKLWIEAQMGLPFDRPLSAVREAVAILRRLFAGEAVEHQGKVFQVGAGLRLAFEPHRKQLPIYIGATGPKAQELAGEIGDGVFPFFCDPAKMATVVERVNAGAARAGRDAARCDISALVFLAAADDDRAAREAVRPLIATFFAWFANQPELPLFAECGLSPGDVEAMREAWARGEVRPDLINDTAVDLMTVAGDPERCREKLAALRDAGLTAPVICPAMVMGGADIAAHLEWLQQHVLRDFY
ncbi:MAG: LLM class flavin-dependent oxidoreductase [Gammaproteobacteria bacterium]|nr:LLM class flavin-dependent oxidoreductase [Gammaproteobacteria bacterium]MCP5200690.1 LLM class flavin-dependent oxidoreductase [Gammaproteobacteria bacterium]